ALIIFVHGFTGSQREHQYFNAAPFFNNNGFSTFRFDLYNNKKGARKISEASFTNHIEDLNQVVDYFKRSYKKIILVGHSLGCLVILKANLANVSRIVLWDPSTGFENISEKKGYYNQEIGKYIIGQWLDIVVGKNLIDEWMKVDIGVMIKNIKIPCKFIFAGGYNKYDLWKPYLNDLHFKNEVVIVKGASHCFDEIGTEVELFKETYNFIKV
ncbi:alpha/beta fold hydrolase, partial [Candidatus Dojkabacteria bacterium]|nr:alpha/beta fold hydrolase [Candidatus Dojkabacteria bacterium]